MRANNELIWLHIDHEVISEHFFLNFDLWPNLKAKELIFYLFRTLAVGWKVWDISGRLIPEHINAPPTPDRTPWLSDLAYAQWRLEELATGEPIRQVRPPIDPLYRKVVGLLLYGVKC
jgi:hypothetical protein